MRVFGTQIAAKLTSLAKTIDEVTKQRDALIAQHGGFD
jgi:hypothetical protein